MLLQSTSGKHSVLHVTETSLIHVQVRGIIASGE